MTQFSTPLDPHNPERQKRTRFNPAAQKRLAQQRARHAWGKGFMSGLPFAEIILLAGFLIGAGLFLSFDTNPETDENTPSEFNTSAP